MKIKCDWCGNWINDFDQVCPSCGGTNSHYRRQSDGTPQTIEELKVWAVAHNLPLEQMRTYIGEDYRGPRAFGIYKDESTQTFVVYKNKDDGSRAVRYQGNDEAYAVNELYMKLKERVAQQKSHMATSQQGNPYRNSYSEGAAPSGSGRKKKSILRRILIMILSLVILSQVIPSIIVMVIMRGVSNIPATGYYTYDSAPYYYYRGDWYEWDTDHWRTTTDTADWMESGYSEYYDSYSYDSESYYGDFEDSPFYSTGSYDSDDDNGWSYDNDWDYDSNWDSDDDWDSGWDDWDSDW